MKITKTLIKEIIKMEYPTSQDIDILREWLWSNFIDKLSLKVLVYLNKKDKTQ